MTLPPPSRALRRASSPARALRTPFALGLTAVLLAGCAATASGTARTASAPLASPSGEAAEAAGSVWVANEAGDSITVLDAADGSTVATLTGIDGPHNVSASSTRPLVWATANGGVTGVDAAGLFAAHAVPAGEHPAHVVESAYGDVLSTASGDGELHRLTTSLEDVATYRVGKGPHGVRVSPDGLTAAVANTGAGSITLLGLRGGEDRTVEVGPSPVQVGFSHDSTTVFVTVAGDSAVVRVDAATGQVTGRVDVPAAPAQLWVTSDGIVLAAGQGTEQTPGGTLTVVDGEDMTVRGAVRTGSGPHGITVDPTETRAWVTNLYDDTVTVVDLTRLTAEATIAVGDAPNGITWSPVAPSPVEHTGHAGHHADGTTGPVVPLQLPHAFAHAEDTGHTH